MRRWAPLLLALVAAVVVLLVVVAGVGSDDEPAPQPPAAPQPSHGEDVTEVVVLLDAQVAPEDARRAVGLITDATRMWQGGLEGLAGSEPDPGAGAVELVIRTETVPAGSSHVLTDPEIVFVVAVDTDTASGSSLSLRNAAGNECAAYPDVFALGAWTARPAFNSHHRLPEGTYDQDCGATGTDVCLAVNGTFVAGGVDPMEAFGLVGDELGHCLRTTRATRG